MKHTLTSWVVAGLLLAAALLPPIWALLSAWPDAGQQSGWRIAGQVTGIAGLHWLLLALILSIRVPRWDIPFGGLLRLWRIHHWLGAASFVALLLHPPLAALARAPDGPAAVLAVLTPAFSHWMIWTGWAGLIAMMAFLAPTFAFFGKPDYRHWKMLHRLSGAAALLGILHALTLAKLLPMPAGYVLWLGLGGMATAALCWRLLLSRVLSRRTYTITAVAPLTDRVVELTLQGPRLDHEPGQFVYLTPFDQELTSGRGEEHPYTLSSAPGEADLRIAIKDLGDATRALMNVKAGSLATIEGPYGQFLPVASAEPAVWIGGGIGMTPFVSAARSLARAGRSFDAHIIYCANDPSRAYFEEELATIVAAVDGLRMHTHYFVEEGPLSREFLEYRIPDLTQRRLLVCGPQPLIDLAVALASAAGIPRSSVATEEFDLL